MSKSKAKASKKASKPTSLPVDIGISKGDRQAIADSLSRLLADSYSLYLKTHNFHWNITGPMFNTLHLMFETQYTEQWQALDDIAERIRALGQRAPGSYREFARLSSIDDNAADIAAGDWRGMVTELVLANEAVCRTAREAFKATDKAADQPTEDLLTQRLQVHEKTAWMLRSLLE
ncbi:Dps family protein [Pseudomarimonas arenosa]|uniref:DNA starvation/stationary phase protection protein n=1 Tax=Pseudomarimonas arenosa TaxID=2774145 RepID=A0AAW3ZNK6_9GAMM|nr:Dps family protein [Pseudomarimonas arenosa]MBD8527119.1 DNA starvation/stationary phase protection protein [Pseudomarimonas arenosa]